MICPTTYGQIVTGTPAPLVRPDTGPDPAAIVRRGLLVNDVRSYARFHGLSLRDATDAIRAAAAQAASS